MMAAIFFIEVGVKKPSILELNWNVRQRKIFFFKNLQISSMFIESNLTTSTSKYNDAISYHSVNPNSIKIVITRKKQQKILDQFSTFVMRMSANNGFWMRVHTASSTTQYQFK